MGTDLLTDLTRRFSMGVRAPWSERAFNDLGLAVFASQFASIPAFRRFCEGRGQTPDTVSSWSAVPPVPATAFKHLGLSTGEPKLVFLTSGTTRGPEKRGRHLVPDPALYRASLRASFSAHVMARRGRIRFVSLVPSPVELPESSLSFMVGAAAEAFATETHWLVDGRGALDEDGLVTVLRRASHAREPVLLLGTALALLHALDRLGPDGLEPLPPLSRVMETGGFKGVAAGTTRTELHERLAEATGLPLDRIVNEYGMTELLSQLYEPVLSEGAEAAGAHVPPPWLKVRALDPVTLAELDPGDEGLLAFFDLANAGSVAHVLTEDVGSVVDGRVHLAGRVEGAEPRGCSRAMDELMTAARSAE